MPQLQDTCLADNIRWYRLAQDTPRTPTSATTFGYNRGSAEKGVSAAE